MQYPLQFQHEKLKTAGVSLERVLKPVLPITSLLAFQVMKENDLNKDKLREISRLRKKAHSTLLKKKSRVYEAFLKMEEATYRDGELDGKIK